jgi:small conductance mechanosensitive channel
LNLDTAVTSLLAGAGIVGLALAFAFQDIAANFVSGIVMSFTRPMEIGDLVRVKDYLGIVESIRLRDSVIRTFQGQKIYIPNKEIFQNPIENFSKYRKRRLDLGVGVSYGDDLAKVKKVSIEALSSIELRTPNDPVELFYEEFADSSINFTIRIWLKSVDQPVYNEARSQAIQKLKAAFDANDIMIPFPIRTLDFGIKGGERLFDTAVSLKQSSE